MHLHADRGDFDADVGRERLGDRRQAGWRGPARWRAASPSLARAMSMACAQRIADGAGNAASAPAWSAGRAARRGDGRSAPCPRRCSRRPCPAGARWHRRAPSASRASATPTPCMPTARRALFIMVNMQARPAVLLADQPADRARRAVLGEAVAIDHGAGRRAMDAELVLDAAAEDIVARAEAAVGARPGISAPGTARCRACRPARRAAAPAPDGRCCR